MASTLTQEQLQQAYQVEILDKEGQKHILGNLVKGKKTALIFIRHYWCGNCQGYVKQLSSVIPPSVLDADTSILIIGCGEPTPIQAYIDLTKTPYPVYGNPTLELYKIFQFKSNLGVSKSGQEKEYEKAIGGVFTRTMRAMRDGPMKNFGHRNAVGPLSQNGGELVLDKDGSVLHFYRMEHTVDHSELRDIAHALGVEPQSVDEMAPTSCEAGVKV